MSKWIEEADRIDKMLSEAGVPHACRMRAVAKIADALAQADKAKRDAEALKARAKRAYVLHKEFGAERAAELMCEPVRTIYWLRELHLNCAMNPDAILQEVA
jgi:nitrogenase molybdenum-iron protein alpha/beta subunit